ncbi:hypothetical protein [Treponema pedis]|uniref:Uncharacterized protein n=1 Tax=Treponema pedis TaxID=409322 RepID=A0A7S7AXL2_9SPIR|nr:hypothetical protein [Treponema pedis]QOW61276.1 hypothetical protein IFE08_02440 [Treponema pedis]
MLNIMTGSFNGSGIDEFKKMQMWDCPEEKKETILSECKYQVIGTDMFAAAFPALERAELDMNFLEALLELFPECDAVYFHNSGKLYLRCRNYRNNICMVLSQKHEVDYPSSRKD